MGEADRDTALPGQHLRFGVRCRNSDAPGLVGRASVAPSRLQERHAAPFEYAPAATAATPPTLPGTAAGVTLGLAVSAGGLFMPLLGLVADHHGPRGAVTVLACIPVIAIAVSTSLREPTRRPGQTVTAS